jgi:hypothetical protein
VIVRPPATTQYYFDAVTGTIPIFSLSLNCLFNQPNAKTYFHHSMKSPRQIFYTFQIEPQTTIEKVARQQS